jgi:hypothetical protein
MAHEEQGDNEGAAQADDPKLGWNWSGAPGGQSAQGISGPGPAGRHVEAHCRFQTVKSKRTHMVHEDAVGDVRSLNVSILHSN